jgi:hypothetical protein
LSEESNDRYTITKDIIGNATLVIKRATKSDAGTYKCRIENTKLFTKCVLTVSGLSIEQKSHEKNQNHTLKLKHLNYNIHKLCLLY